MRTPEEIEARRAWVQGTVTRMDLAQNKATLRSSDHIAFRLICETLEWVQGSAAPITERLVTNTGRTLDVIGVQEVGEGAYADSKRT